MVGCIVNFVKLPCNCCDQCRIFFTLHCHHCW